MAQRSDPFLWMHQTPEEELTYNDTVRSPGDFSWMYQDYEQEIDEEEERKQRIAEEEQNNRGLLDRGKDILKKGGELAKGIYEVTKEKYTELGEGGGEWLADVTGKTEKEQAAWDSREATNEAAIRQANEKLKGKLSKEQKEQWKKIRESAIKDSQALYEERTGANKQRMERTNPKEQAMNVLGVGVDILSAGQLPIGQATKGAKTLRMTNNLPGYKTAGQGVLRGGMEGGGLEGVASVVRQASDEEPGISLKQTLQDIGFGAFIGGGMGGIQGKLASRGDARAAAAKAAEDTRLFTPLDEAADDLARSMDAEDAFRASQNPTDRITDPNRMLPSGEDTIKARIAEIDDEIGALQRGEVDPNVYGVNTEDITALAGEPAGNAQLTKAGEIDQRSGKNVGTFAKDSPATVATATETAERSRALLRERETLTKRLERAPVEQLPDDVPVSQAAQADPAVRKVVQQDTANIDRALASADPSYTPGMIAELATPERVFKKAGLGEVFDTVRVGYDNMTRAKNSFLRQAGDWAERLGRDKDSAQRVARALDGEVVNLNMAEAQVAGEVRKVLDDIADQLDLPQDARISEYLPHIFGGDKGSKQVADALEKLADPNISAATRKRLEKVVAKADPNLRQLMRKNASGKVFNPFRKKRTGAEGYSLDLFEIMDVYTNKAYMDIHMSEGLGALQKSKAAVSQEMAEYVNDQINILKNTPDAQAEITRRLDTTLQSVGIRPGAVEDASAMTRAIIYRATLGLNTGSAVRNFTQTANTVGKLGTKWTAVGGKQALQAMTTRNMDELVEMNVLDDTLNEALRGTHLKMGNRVVDGADKILWAQFQTAEHLNRATAYYGAKAKALANHATEAQARKAGAAMARQTQFKFSPIDTPHMLRGPITKNLTQFMSFNIKQVEFISDMIKGSDGMFQKTAQGAWKLSPDGTWKMARFIGANYAFMVSVGTLIGMEPEDFVPFLGNIKEGELPRSPIMQLLAGDQGKEGLKNIITGEDAYGNKPKDAEGNEMGGLEARLNIAKDFATDEAFGLVVPGGTQIKKTSEGLETTERGASVTGAGRVRYTVPEDQNEVRAALFGQNNLPQAQDFYEGGGSPLSAHQSEVVLGAEDEEAKEMYYQFYSQMQGASTERSKASREVTELVKRGEINRAQRRAQEWNEQIAIDLGEWITSGDPTIKEEIESLMIPVDSGSMRRRR